LHLQAKYITEYNFVNTKSYAGRKVKSLQPAGHPRRTALTLPE